MMAYVYKRSDLQGFFCIFARLKSEVSVLLLLTDGFLPLLIIKPLTQYKKPWKN